MITRRSLFALVCALPLLPAHVASRYYRDRVRLLAAFGWNDARIAKALHLTLPMLRGHYTSELKFRDRALVGIDAGGPGFKFVAVSALDRQFIGSFSIDEISAMNDLIERRRA